MFSFILVLSVEISRCVQFDLNLRFLKPTVELVRQIAELINLLILIIDKFLTGQFLGHIVVSCLFA